MVLLNLQLDWTLVALSILSPLRCVVAESIATVLKSRCQMCDLHSYSEGVYSRHHVHIHYNKTEDFLNFFRANGKRLLFVCLASSALQWGGKEPYHDKIITVLLMLLFLCLAPRQHFSVVGEDGTAATTLRAVARWIVQAQATHKSKARLSQPLLANLTCPRHKKSKYESCEGILLQGAAEAVLQMLEI